jgi:hypothetical protein
MSNFLFENVLLSVGLQSSASAIEWEGSSLVIKNSALTSLSLEFFFSYFNYFTATIVLTPLMVAEFDAYNQNLLVLSRLMTSGTGIYALLYPLQ